MNIAIFDSRFNGEAVQTINARDLHEFLEVGKDFSTWIKDRIAQYGFEENQDFLVFTETGENSSGGRPAKEYHISLDMAKELSMVERNDKGKQARQYFIEMERRAKTGPVMIDLDDPGQLRGLLSSYAERTEVAEARVADLTPKAEAFDLLDASDGSVTPRVAAKTLDKQERKFSKWLEVNSWCFRQGGKGPLQAYADRRKQGYLEHKLHTYTDHSGEERVRAQVMITPKGMARLAQIFSGAAS